MANHGIVFQNAGTRDMVFFGVCFGLWHDYGGFGTSGMLISCLTGGNFIIFLYSGSLSSSGLNALRISMNTKYKL